MQEMIGRFEFTEDPHKRFNPLTNKWILCSPHRAKRPWQGQEEQQSIGSGQDYVHDCFLWYALLTG